VGQARIVGSVSSGRLDIFGATSATDGAFSLNSVATRSFVIRDEYSAVERMRITSAGAVYIGNGEFSTTPANGFLLATGGSGTDIAGAAMLIWGGRSTGSAAGGPITFSTSPAGTTGTSLNAGTERMRIDSSGNVSIGSSSTPTKLFIQGTASATGGIRLQNSGGNPYSIWTDANSLYVSRGDGTTTALAVTFGGSVGIGTASPAQALDVAGSIRGTGNLSLAGQSTADQIITVGGNRTGDGNSYVNLIGDTTYTTFGTRLIRGNTGANASSSLIHRGTGLLSINAQDAGAIQFSTTNTERMRIDSSGNVGIGTTAPAAKLEVALGANGEYMRVGGDDATNNRALRFTSSTTGGSVGALHTINASSSSGVIALATNSTERLRITSAGNLLLGTTTDFTSTTTAGGMALTGYGIYPYTTQTGATNSTVLSSLTAVPTLAATGSASTLLVGGQFSPAMSNDGTGGSNSVGALGINSVPVITSSGSTALVSLSSIQATSNRGNASDTSANASNFIISGNFVATHGTGLPDTAVSGTAYSLSGSIVNASGTMTTAAAVRAQINLGSSSTYKTNSTPTAAGFELSTFAVGAATAVGNATVTNGYGIKLAGPNVGVTGTMTNYYAFRADSPTVTGTLTNRYGIWINDSLSTNYFAGTVGVGTSTPNAASIIDAQSTTKGVRFPNMTTTQKNAMANVAGNVIFDTTLGKLCVNTGSGWQTITSV
jgi:hypothetical protein